MQKNHALLAGAVSAVLAVPAYAEEPIVFSGAVEVEAAMAEDFAGAKSSDIVLATVELAADAVISERVNAHIGLLYEEDDTDFGLDEGYVVLQASDTMSITAGRLYVPFGSFESNMVSDPLTLELGETSETALMIGVDSGNTAASFYTFNGDSQEAAEVAAGDDDSLGFGVSIAYGNESMALGASYLSNLADSDALQSLDNGGGNVGVVDSTVAGIGVNFAYRMGSFTLLAEHVTAMDNFVAGDLDNSVTADRTPAATSIELAYDSGTAIFAVAHQVTDEADFAELPETATSVAVSYEVMAGADLGIEYLSAEDYAGNDASAFTMQLAVDF